MNLRTKDFYYDLPPELIAQHPTSLRSHSRLLVVLDNCLVDEMFSGLLKWLRPNDLLVFNNTRVMKARFYGHKDSGGKIECLVERVLNTREAWVHFRASHAPKVGSVLRFTRDITLKVLERDDGLFRVRLDGYDSIWAWMEDCGQLPLPPYIDRPPEGEDAERYQTVYASVLGAVAAPTAGLHFDETLLSALQSAQIRSSMVTLHVGAGTFMPVKTEWIHQHQMHSEYFEVSEETQRMIAETKALGGRVVAVGTTALRALESAYQNPECVALMGDTRLFITPGYHFKVVDALITNFHLPESSLLMLVSAFSGIESIRQAYRHAIEQRYRFFSYGDAMFLERS
jgi:S-adenosylmethionine:tRNA ribosyltransferase-isomerase